MSLWKKTKELFKRLKGDDSNTPPSAPAADPLLPVIFEPLPAWKQAQRDAAAALKAVTIRWNSMSKALGGQGTMNLGRNKAKRKLRVGSRKYWPVLKAVA